MEPEHRRWIVVNALAITALINVVLNAGPAWLAARSLDHIPLWTVPFADTGVYTDTLGTMLILPFVTTLIATTVVWRDRERGDLPRLRGLRGTLRFLGSLSSRRVPRALALSVLTVVLLAPCTAGLLAIAAPDGLDDGAFIAYKTVLGVGLGLVVTPLVALLAMADRR